MNKTITIGLTGDVMLGRTLDSVISKRGYDYPWGNMLSLMQQADINIVNLETTLTYSQQKVPKTFNFKSTPDKVESLLMANITVANLANNHILDYSTAGLTETIQTLDEANIKHVGAGKNYDDATKSIIIEKNNLRIGVLGVTDNEPGWKAEHGPGINYVDLTIKDEKEKILYEIKQIRGQSDIVIVSIHWGPNMQDKPYPHFIKFAHDMIDYGAHVIHGHSAHILQGIECYHDNLILYDTGDFVDDYAVDPDLRNDLSAYFVLHVDNRGVHKLRCIPSRIFQYQVNRARDDDYQWVISRLKNLSSDFGTTMDDGMVTMHRALQHKNQTSGT